MHKIIDFFSTLPMRFPYTSGLMLFTLFLNAHFFFKTRDIGYLPGGWGLAFLYYWIVVLALIVTVVLFLFEVLFFFEVSKPQEKVFSDEQRKLSALLWVLFILGMVPATIMFGPAVMSISGADKVVEEAPYWFARPQEKLEHDLKKNRLEHVRKYMAEGADINTTDRNGRTSLSLAIEQNDLALAKELIMNGADVNIQDRQGNDVLSNALPPFPISSTPLGLNKSSPQKAEIIFLLLKHGATVSPNSNLQWAVATGSIELVDELMKRGLTLDKKGRSKKGPYLYQAYDCQHSPLSVAAELGEPNMVEFLLRKGAPVNGEAAPKSCSPLFSAVLHKQNNTAKLLIQHGADVNSLDTNTGKSVLIQAAQFHCDDELFSMLIARGAQVNTASISGETALSRVAEQGDLKKVKILQKAGAKFKLSKQYSNRTLSEAISSHNLALVKSILKQGVKPEAIHLAAALKEDQPEMAILFLKKGVDPNIPTLSTPPSDVPFPPLYTAIEFNDSTFVKLLLENGADPKILGAYDEGLIETAVLSKKSQKTLTIIQLLIDHGADINQRDYYGRTALDVLIRHKSPNGKLENEIEAILRKNGGKASTSN